MAESRGSEHFWFMVPGAEDSLYSPITLGPLGRGLPPVVRPILGEKLARDHEQALHVLVATDIAGDNIRIVTAYRPSPREWQDDLKTRRPKQ